MRRVSLQRFDLELKSAFLPAAEGARVSDWLEYDLSYLTAQSTIITLRL